MKTLALALSFLTTIPMPHVGMASDEEMNATLGFFPLVGLLVGLVNAGLFLVGVRLWSPQIAAWLWLISNAIITGALHLDGWMDTFDALGSRKSRSEMLEIMKDSRIGAVGTTAALLLLGLKWSLLIVSVSTIAALVIAPAVGKVGVVLATQAFPYGREKGLGQALTKPMQLSGWFFALGVAVVTTIAFLRMPGLIALAVSLMVGLAWAHTLSRKFGGLTGDSYGAVNELVELVFLLVFLARVTI
ncbi:MAG: Adenosylcobinamide-GDP ribazoletransferase [Firmicutes bacterium]|nr:Adenosylcobinamide-GDP ribazoletransferase [Bacillota bacterium]